MVLNYYIKYYCITFKFSTFEGYFIADQRSKQFFTLFVTRSQLYVFFIIHYFFFSISNKKTYYSNNTARSLASDQDLEVEKPKKKKRNKKGRKKRRVPRTTEYDQNIDDEHMYEDLPTSTPRAMPPSYTSLPKSLKPLPKRLKTPSEASFATNSTCVKSRTDQSNSGGFSSSEYRKTKKEHAIKIDSDNEDLR